MCGIRHVIIADHHGFRESSLLGIKVIINLIFNNDSSKFLTCWKDGPNLMNYKRKRGGVKCLYTENIHNFIELFSAKKVMKITTLLMDIPKKRALQNITAVSYHVSSFLHSLLQFMKKI
jgi:hypothetical protein